MSKIWIAPAVLVCAIFTGTGLAATPKPYQWTPAQAAAEIKSYGDDLTGEDIKSLACRGTGKRVAGRFVAFRCAATFDGGGNSLNPTPDVKMMLIAKTRRAGGLCFSPTSTVPGACLAPGTRAKGSRNDAYFAYRKTGPNTVQSEIAVTNYGSGYYAVYSADVLLAWVMFAPRPIVKLVS